MPNAVSISKAVLVRTGSVTHHADHNQRVVSLEYIPNPELRQLQVQMPAPSYVVPRGYYMLFLVSSQGVPSVATWVKVVT